jgi:hypothetical protein
MEAARKGLSSQKPGLGVNVHSYPGFFVVCQHIGCGRGSPAGGRACHRF